jgi:hypothetical protein
MHWKEAINQLEPEQSIAIKIDIGHQPFRNYLTRFKKQSGWLLWHRQIDGNLFVVTRWQ